MTTAVGDLNLVYFYHENRQADSGLDQWHRMELAVFFENEHKKNEIAMITFENIVRKWCKLYRPILDSPKSRKFFFTDSRENMIEMAKKWTPAMSPCVVMEGVAEGGGTIERPSMNYRIYFFVRAKNQKDGDSTWLAVKEALQHKDNFLAWLKKKRDEEMDNGVLDGDFSRIDLDNAMQDITTVGPLEDGWYAVLLQLEREEPLNLCVNEDLYISEQ